MAFDKAIDTHLINLVQTQTIREQSELQQLMCKRGYDIPQATLSRRLKKLKVAKIDGAYQLVEHNLPNLPVILNIKVSDFGLLILHTYPGSASSLAYFIDQKFVDFHPQSQKNTAILGTIAGDDTVLLIVESQSKLKAVMESLERVFPYLKPPL